MPLGEREQVQAMLGQSAMDLFAARAALYAAARAAESGGDPDGASGLSELLSENDFVIRSATPHIFCIRPTDYMWQWPAQFIEVYLPRLQEMGRIDQNFAGKVRADLASAEKNRNSLMITPLVLEIIAEKTA